MREAALTSEAVVARHIEPLLAGSYGIAELQGLTCLEFAFGMENGILCLKLFIGVLFGFVMLPLLRLRAVPVTVFRLWDNGNGEGTVSKMLVRDGTIRSGVAVRSRARALSGFELILRYRRSVPTISRTLGYRAGNLGGRQ